MRKNGLISIVILLLFITPILANCGGGSDPEPTATPMPPTATTVPATAAPEPTEEPAEEPEDEATEEPAEEPADDDSGEAEEPAEEPADDDSGEAEEPAEEPADDDSGEAEEPAEEPADDDSGEAEEPAADDAGAVDRSGEIDKRTGEAYPAPLADGAYPAPAAAAAAPIAEEYPEPIPCPSYVFDINEPLRDGDMTISGAGVEDVGILIVSVTTMGEELGEATIGEDGTWSIDVEEPLLENHGLGIRLVSTPPEFEDQEAFIASHIWPCGGDQLKDYPIPSIGLLLDFAQVQSADFE